MISAREKIPLPMCLIALTCLILIHAPMTRTAKADDPPDTGEARGAVIAVHCAAEGLGALCRAQEDPAQRIASIRTYIEPIRFYPDRSGYFYVYDFDCRNIAHATQKDLVGRNLYNYQDTKGKYVIRELAEAARKGGGFVTYHWIKPGSEGEKLKLGYVEPIPGTDYFIGTGMYEGAPTEGGAAQDAALGEKLERTLWEDIRNERWDQVDPRIAAAFQSVHQDGASLAEDEKDLLRKLDLDEYELTKFAVTRSGPVIVVSYKAAVGETLGGQRQPRRASMRQSVWLQSGTSWQWIAHANLNPVHRSKPHR